MRRRLIVFALTALAAGAQVPQLESWTDTTFTAWRNQRTEINVNAQLRAYPTRFDAYRTRTGPIIEHRLRDGLSLWGGAYFQHLQFGVGENQTFDNFARFFGGLNYRLYRNRLIRAYLGASNANRNPNPFTGFDSRDNLRFHNLEQRPLHVVNMALNLVSTNNLAWQQRKAETFTANALHVGNFRLGYRRADEYALNERDEGLSLGTAITISGAAASPNQGYHSSPTIAMLMTLFNVRLGAWLGNPGAAGNKTFRHSGPKSPVFHVFKEAFGLTSDDSPYVYLSDGGHFENLGLYEMVLRRCHYIVVSDAGCDPKCQLEDLGNALRKIRVDLGIPITMHRFGIYSRDADKTGRYCAVGTIHYDKVDGANARPGLLLYLKPAICGGEPQDIFNYKETSPCFPHEPTSDQWFSESQFESYRMLGQHIVQVMADDWERVRQHDPREHPLATFIRQSYKYLEIPFPPDLGRRLEGLGKTELHRGDTVRVGREASPATPGEAASPKAP